MTAEGSESSADAGYAMNLANGSYDWYRAHAIRSRRAYKVNEMASLWYLQPFPLRRSSCRTIPPWLPSWAPWW